MMQLLESLFSHHKNIPSLMNPATHTFKMSQWAANADVGEGDMGTNVVWMYPQLWQPKDDSKAPRTHLSDGIDQTHGHHYDKYNTHMGMPGH